MSINANDVKQLREMTGAGMMDCKKALTEAGGNFDKAVTWLREKGMASAAKRAGRTASEGSIKSYIHPGGKYGVLAEINCETDFVARGDLFEQFCSDVCQHICAANPRWVRREEVPQDAIEAELSIYRNQAADSGKPENIRQKMAEGRLNKWYEEVCLYEQKYVKDQDKTIEELAKSRPIQVI